MESNLFGFKKAAKRLGLCEEYKCRWDNCKSKEDLIKLALTSNGIEFIADSIAFKWGVSKEYITKEFKDFISDTEKHVVLNEGGYTSEMYAMLNSGIIEPHGSQNIIISCNCTIKLRKHFIGMIYICGSATVNIDASQSNELRLIVYGNDNNITFTENGDGKIIIENVQKSKWVK